MKVYKAAIYHFTFGELDNNYCRNAISRLQLLAKVLGYDDVDVYVDYKTNGEEHGEYDKMLSKIDEYDTILVSTLAHIYKYTLKTISVLKWLASKNIKVYSLEQSPYIFGDHPDFDQPLNVATYYCHRGNREDAANMEIKNESLRIFIEKQTNWTLIGQYSEEGRKSRAGKQPQLENLIKKKSTFDLLLIPSFISIHWQTNAFCRYRDLIDRDIYALDGGLLRKEHIVR